MDRLFPLVSYYEEQVRYTALDQRIAPAETLRRVDESGEEAYFVMLSEASPPARPRKRKARDATGRCGSTQCTLGAGHGGLCSHMQVSGRRRLS